MIILKSCPRCTTGALTVLDDVLDGKTYACLQCGHYIYDLEKGNLNPVSEDKKELLAVEVK